MCYQAYNGISNAAPVDLEVTPLWGTVPPTINETLLGLKYVVEFSRVLSMMKKRLLSFSTCLSDCLIYVCFSFRIAPTAFFQTNSLGAEVSINFYSCSNKGSVFK
jgi:hypothetical protein